MTRTRRRLIWIELQRLRAPHGAARIGPHVTCSHPGAWRAGAPNDNEQDTMNAAKKPAAATQQTSLAPVALGDELAGYAEQGLDLDGGSDGLAETDAQDFKLPAKILNKKGLGPDGRRIAEDMYYDTVTETQDSSITAVFVDLHKRNVWSQFDQANDRTEVICSSDDRKVGVMAETGEQRPCKGCPDAQWQTVNGKRSVRCGPVYDVFALERATMRPFVTRYKKTSLPVIRQHLQRHHLRVRRTAQGMANYPLYAFEVVLTAEMSADGKYALPVLTRGPVLGIEDMRTAQIMSRSLREHALPPQLDGEGDASFEYGAAAGGGAAHSGIEDDDTKPIDSQV